MKSSRAVLLAVLVLVLVLTVGCNKTDQVQTNPAAGEEKSDTGIKIPEENPALTGRVKEIIGNEVTIYKMEMPQRQGGNGEAKANNNTNPPAATDSQGQDTGREARREMMTQTGETETFLIPVGTPIVQRQRGNAEPTTVELSEIKADQMMSIWKEDDTIVLVQVMGTGANRSGGQGNNGGGQGGFPGGPGGPM